MSSICQISNKTGIPLSTCFPNITQAWPTDEPSDLGVMIYTFVVPVLAVFGIAANSINGIIFMRPKMTPSAFTYLAALAWMDCSSCIMIVVSSLTKSLFYMNYTWVQCDIQLQLPIFGVTTGAANFILVFVTLDRLIYIKYGLPKDVPKFCSRRIARWVVTGISVLAIILNIPYFFIFDNVDGQFVTTPFFHSTYYLIHNWINFILVALFPAIFLMIGNSIMVTVIRKWAASPCLQPDGTMSRDRKRYYFQIKLTISLVAIICLFFIGAIPAHLASPKSAISLLFAGDITRMESETMDTVRLIVSVLNAFQLSFNIVIYSILNPAFLTELFSSLHIMSDKFRSFSGINVVVKSYKGVKPYLKWDKIKARIIATDSGVNNSRNVIIATVSRSNTNSSETITTCVEINPHASQVLQVCRVQSGPIECGTRNTKSCDFTHRSCSKLSYENLADFSCTTNRNQRFSVPTCATNSLYPKLP